MSRKGTDLIRLLLAVCAAALVLAETAAGGGRRAADTLNVRAVFNVAASSVSCSAGSPAGAACYAVRGSATIRGLGRVTDQHMIMTVGAADGSKTACATLSFSPEVLTIVGKGQIDSSIMVAAGCNGIPTGFTVTGGSGDFTGATGNGSFQPGIVQSGHWVDTDDNNPEADDILNDWHTDTWTGSLSAANYTFDLTPPVISGAVSKKVTAPSGAKHVRVRFSVTAKDAVDGRVHATCKPRSGSLFRIGRTHVKCTATDSSANTATAHFTITVKQRP